MKSLGLSLYAEKKTSGVTARLEPKLIDLNSFSLACAIKVQEGCGLFIKSVILLFRGAALNVDVIVQYDSVK